MCSVLALCGFLDLVRDPEYIGKNLLEHLLGTMRALCFDDPYTAPSAELLPQFYKYVAQTHKVIAERLPGVEVRPY